MKFILFCSLMIFATACTSESQKLEDQAVSEATKDFQTELRDELGKSITGKSKIQFTAVDIITKKTEFVVSKKGVDDSLADFEVDAKTIPAKVRSSLIEIMAKLDPSKEGRFNVSDAIKLVTENLGLPKDQTTTLTYKIKFKKVSGDWKREEAAKNP